MEWEGDMLIFDTGGGRNGTITKREWHVFEYKNNKHRLLVYQDKSAQKDYPIVNTVTKT